MSDTVEAHGDMLYPPLQALSRFQHLAAGAIDLGAQHTVVRYA